MAPLPSGSEALTAQCAASGACCIREMELHLRIVGRARRAYELKSFLLYRSYRAEAKWQRVQRFSLQFYCYNCFLGQLGQSQLSAAAAAATDAAIAAVRVAVASKAAGALASGPQMVPLSSRTYGFDCSGCCRLATLHSRKGTALPRGGRRARLVGPRSPECRGDI